MLRVTCYMPAWSWAKSMHSFDGRRHLFNPSWLDRDGFLCTINLSNLSLDDHTFFRFYSLHDHLVLFDWDFHSGFIINWKHTFALNYLCTDLISPILGTSANWFTFLFEHRSIWRGVLSRFILRYFSYIFEHFLDHPLALHVQFEVYL